MSDNTFTIEINGTSLEAKPGQMLIEVADAAGIRIPRFCYHSKLSIAANCRMCLVEVEKAPKPLPACATPVMDGMKVHTRSPLALSAQKATMEFLLINHPLDCPICDQGGECELQDVAMGYGGDVSQYSESKRIVGDRNIGPLIATEMTRCIHCTRCVRFGQEVAGIREMGATGRGEHTLIGTYIEASVDSELSGNVIDLCPVGALTAKPSRYSARAWELGQANSVAAHDCVGSNTHVHTFRGKVNRVVPRDNEAVNECWISDRDRFSYDGLNCESRLQTPMIKINGNWQETSWENALNKAATDLIAACGDIGGLVSPNATTEEMYLAARLLNGLGSHNIDHRLRQSDFSGQDAMPGMPGMSVGIDELEKQDAVLLVGSNIRKDQPIISHRLRKAALAGANIMFINSREFEFNFPVKGQLAGSPADMVAALAGVARALADAGKSVPGNVASLVAGASVTDEHKSMADALSNAEAGQVVLGTQASHMPGYSTISQLARAIAGMSDCGLSILTDGANSAGAWAAGAVPHRVAGGAADSDAGLNAVQMLEQQQKAYVLLGVEPEYDCGNPAAAIRAMNGADTVVALTAYVTDSMKDYADVLLPVSPATETSGTYINVNGEWQGFQGACKPLGETRPGWKVLRVLCNMADVSDSEYNSSEEVIDELRAACEGLDISGQLSESTDLMAPETLSGVQRLSAPSIYSVDAVVRRSGPLQETVDGDDQSVRINATMADKLGFNDVARVLVHQDGSQVSMELEIDNGVPDNCAWIPAGGVGSAGLAAMYGEVRLEAD